MVAIIIPHQLSLAPPTSCLLTPHPLSPLPFSADRFPIHSGPLFCFHQSAFLFPAIFSPVSFGLLSCFLWPAPLFPSFRLLVPFGPFSCSLCSASSFLSVRSSVPFVPFSCSLCFASSFLSVRYSLSFVPRSCSLRPASPFLSVRSFVSFVPLLPFFCTPLLFSLFCFFVSFGPLLRFLRSVSCSFWSGSTRHCLVVSSFPSLSSLSFCQLFSPLSNPTHALQRSRRRSSTFETTPFLLQEHALQRLRQRPSSLVSVCAWFRVSCKFRFASFPPPCVVAFVCILVKFFHNPKRLIGSFLSHVV